MTELIQHLSLGFSVALTLQNLMYCFIGCFLGTLIGVCRASARWRRSRCCCQLRSTCRRRRR